MVPGPLLSASSVCGPAAFSQTFTFAVNVKQKEYLALASKPPCGQHAFCLASVRLVADLVQYTEEAAGVAEEVVVAAAALAVHPGSERRHEAARADHRSGPEDRKNSAAAVARATVQDHPGRCGKGKLRRRTESKTACRAAREEECWPLSAPCDGGASKRCRVAMRAAEAATSQRFLGRRR